MAKSARAKQIVSKITNEKTKLGDIKKLAKEIKKDHELALELWSTGDHQPRLLATLIFDKKQLTESVLEGFASDLMVHDEDKRSQIVDWLLANQLMKDRKLVALLETWEDHPSPVMRRLFWYHQARLRWMGNTPPPPNSPQLMDSLEANLATEEPEVQWAMNFCAGQIGVFEPKLRPRCIKLGKTLGLYKDQSVPKNCTPSYLPEFIRIEVAKRK